MKILLNTNINSPCTFRGINNSNNKPINNPINLNNQTLVSLKTSIAFKSFIKLEKSIPKAVRVIKKDLRTKLQGIMLDGETHFFAKNQVTTIVKAFKPCPEHNELIEGLINKKGTHFNAAQITELFEFASKPYNLQPIQAIVHVATEIHNHGEDLPIRLFNELKNGEKTWTPDRTYHGGKFVDTNPVERPEGLSNMDKLLYQKLDSVQHQCGIPKFTEIQKTRIVTALSNPEVFDLIGSRELLQEMLHDTEGRFNPEQTTKIIEFATKKHANLQPAEFAIKITGGSFSEGSKLFSSGEEVLRFIKDLDEGKYKWIPGETYLGGKVKQIKKKH